MTHRSSFYSWASLAAGVAVFLFAPPTGAAPGHLSQLDEILMSGGGVRGLLRSRATTNRYYDAWLRYVGGDADRFSRAGFDRILAQVAAHIDRMPTLERRLMEVPEQFGPFQYEIGNLQGVTVEEGDFYRFLAEWMNALLVDSQVVGAMPRGHRGFLQGIEEDINWWHARERDFQASLNGFGRRERDRRTGLYIAELASEPRVTRTLARVILQAIWIDVLQSIPNPDSLDGNSTAGGLVFLDLLSRVLAFREQPRLLYARLEVDRSGRDLPMGMATLLKRALPTLPDLIAWRSESQPSIKLFSSTGVSGRGQLTLVTVPRRFHGIFKGIPLRECLGGDSNNLDACTIQRWGTALVDRSILQFGEVRGRFGGYAQLIPIQLGGRSMQSLDLLFSGLALHERGAPGGSRLLLTRWLDDLSRAKGADFAPVILSDSKYIDHTNASRAVRSSALWRSAPKVSSIIRGAAPLDSQLTDEIREFWTGPSPLHAYTRGSNALIFAATNDDVSSYRIVGGVVGQGLGEQRLEREASGRFEPALNRDVVRLLREAGVSQQVGLSVYERSLRENVFGAVQALVRENGALVGGTLVGAANVLAAKVGLLLGVSSFGFVGDKLAFVIGVGGASVGHVLRLSRMQRTEGRLVANALVTRVTTQPLRSTLASAPYTIPIAAAMTAAIGACLQSIRP